MIKLIASDLDGTIMDNSYCIHKNNIEAIETLKKHNIPLVICTGKTYGISKDICQSLKADFGIFCNGGQIVNLSTGEEIVKSSIPISNINTCLSIIKDHNLHIHAYTDKSIITSKPMYMDLRNSILFPNKIKFEIVNSILDYIYLSSESILKLIISSPNSLLKIKNQLEKNTNLSITHISKTGVYKDNIINKEYEYLDISPINVTKGNALKILSNYLHLDKSNILSIGDNLNDIDMFKVSDTSVAVNNAHILVKNASNYITQKSADNGGFSEAIYKFIPY